MKSVILAAVAACVCVPAFGQEWVGTPTAPTTITNGGGVTLTSNNADVRQSVSDVLIQYCRNGTQIHPGPCAAGEVPHFVSPPHPNDYQYPQLSQVPTAATAPGSLVSIVASGIVRDSSSPTGFGYVNLNLPLSAFATSSSVAALSARVDSLGGDYATKEQVQLLSDRIDTFIAEQRRTTDEIRAVSLEARKGIALSSSLNLTGPADGRQNRLAFGVGTFANQSAISLNYSRRSENVDFGIAAAFSDGQALGKAGVGFSW